MHYKGRCHCGAITFAFDGDEITRGLRCNCSLCSRRGAVMSHEVFPRERFHIAVAGDALGRYQFGAQSVTHYFCRNCGIYPFHESSRKPGYRVNLGCVDSVDTTLLEADLFDGRSLP